MVDEHDGISVCHQIVHNAFQPFDIGRMQANGRLVQYIEDACRAVADGPRELHALSFASGERRGRAVERKIAESELQETPRHVMKGVADAFRHGAHVFRQGVRHTLHPV